MTFHEEGAMLEQDLPVLIQGGMGVSVSNWRLARAVATASERLGVLNLGVVSGTGLGVVIARRLQDGDPGGHLSVAFDAFPYPEMARRVWQAWYIPGGKPRNKPWKSVPMVNLHLRQDVAELIVCANFAEVWLAKAGHSKPVGINYLEKIQTPRLPELLGAMLAGVDYIVVGAGIPYQIPGVLDEFAGYRTASYYLDVEGAAAREVCMTLAPASLVPERYVQHLRRPRFLAIASTHVLAQYLCDRRRTTGRVDGFIMENHTSGGHNAPPRDRSTLTGRGEPIYGEKDALDIRKVSELGRPFWLAGSYAHPNKVAQALQDGSAGCQLGTIFALAEESGLREDIKRALRRLAFHGTLDVISDPRTSSSGFPFNVVQLPGTIADPRVYQARPRICDLGYLRQAYKTPSGSVAFRCPAEPIDVYLKRGGKIDDTIGRCCLCNGLSAAADLGQVHPTGEEQPIVTLGKETDFIHDLVRDEDGSYTAEDAIRYLLNLKNCQTAHHPFS